MVTSSLACIYGQVTKHATVNWPMGYTCIKTAIYDATIVIPNNCPIISHDKTLLLAKYLKDLYIEFSASLKF